MTTLSTQAEPAVTLLLESDEDQLFEQLGMRVQAIESTPEVAGSFDPALTYDGTSMGTLDTLRELGTRIFMRWEKETYSLVCESSGDDPTDRSKKAEAFETGGTAVAALMAGALVSTFGLAPALAAVIAAIVVKRFMRPAYEEFCRVWHERLEPLS